MVGVYLDSIYFLQMNILKWSTYNIYSYINIDILRKEVANTIG